MSLRDKYAGLLVTAAERVKNLDVREDGGRLELKGTVTYKMDGDAIWDKIKVYQGWQQEIIAHLPVERTDIYGVYVVKSGDTLSALSKAHFGDPRRFMEIFKLNADVLTDPNQIKAGQQIKLPPKA